MDRGWPGRLFFESDKINILYYYSTEFKTIYFFTFKNKGMYPIKTELSDVIGYITHYLRPYNHKCNHNRMESLIKSKETRFKKSIIIKDYIFKMDQSWPNRLFLYSDLTNNSSENLIRVYFQ